MTRYLRKWFILNLHRRAIRTHGGSDGIRDIGGLDAAIAQPKMTFDGNELYPTLVEKVAALGYSIIMNHPFVDGNKRVGLLAMESMLMLNGWECMSNVNEAEALILDVAAGRCSRQELTDWLKIHVRPLSPTS